MFSQLISKKKEKKGSAGNLLGRWALIEKVSGREALMPKKRLERGAKLWVGALSDNSEGVKARSGEVKNLRSVERFLPLPPKGRQKVKSKIRKTWKSQEKTQSQILNFRYKSRKRDDVVLHWSFFFLWDLANLLKFCTLDCSTMLFMDSLDGLWPLLKTTSFVRSTMLKNAGRSYDRGVQDTDWWRRKHWTETQPNTSNSSDLRIPRKIRYGRRDW